MKSIFLNWPSPIELVLDPVSLIVLGIYASLILWEALFPARKLPRVKYWRVKGLMAFVLFFYLSSYLPLVWDNYLANYQVFDLTGLGIYWGALVGVLVYELGEYTWHRTMHNSDFLWRAIHQMHHSAERLDSYGAFYFSPLDMMGWVLVSSLCLVLVVGLTPEAATLVILVTTFLTIFQHTNIKTPRWIGYFIQRPEAHSIHHARGCMPIIMRELLFMICCLEHLRTQKTMSWNLVFTTGHLIVFGKCSFLKMSPNLILCKLHLMKLSIPTIIELTFKTKIMKPINSILILWLVAATSCSSDDYTGEAPVRDNRTLNVIGRGTAIAQVKTVEDPDTGEPTEAFCFLMDLFDADSGQLIGSLTDCDLGTTESPDGSLISKIITTFNITGRGSITSRGDVLQIPLGENKFSTAFTPQENNILSTTFDFEGFVGKSTLTGVVDLSRLEQDIIEFDCNFVIELESVN
ncbi:sterol desaturase family protein [Croceiramulus getboli]|nr:sterol desaturase family protein [Flavobacteriaceae bacterium YJPT1-3]